MKKNACSTEAARRLGQAVEQLEENLRRVEIWAGAVSGFSHPVPDYSPSEKYALPERTDAAEKPGSGDRRGDT